MRYMPAEDTLCKFLPGRRGRAKERVHWILHVGGPHSSNLGPNSPMRCTGKDVWMTMLDARMVDWE
eukprot:362033-Chlamydomonas_euryale.AAC.2